MQIALDDLTTQEYDASITTKTYTEYIFTIPSGQEFTGFWIAGYTSGCVVTQLTALTRPAVCSVSFDLTTIDGQSQIVNIDTTTSIAFTTTTCDCGTATIEYQVTYSPSSKTPNLITLPTSTTSTIQFAQSLDTLDVGAYTLTVNARPVGSSIWSSTATATYNYIDQSCLTTVLSVAIPSDMITSVLAQVTPGGSLLVETQKTTTTDSESQSNGILNYCGNYFYSISSVPFSATTPLSVSELAIDSTTGLISLYAASNDVTGIHIAILTVKLDGQPSVTAFTALFQIQINPCIVTSYTMSSLSPSFDRTFTIGDPSLSWLLVGTSEVTQVPACAYTQTITSQSTTQILTSVAGTDISFTAFSRNSLDVGLFQVFVTSTLNNYPYSQIPMTCQSSFYLNVLDPCFASIAWSVPVTIENLVAFAGRTSASKFKYTFLETPDVCGEKQLTFLVNDTVTTYLQAINADYIYFSPPAETTFFGSSQVKVQAVLVNYPTVKSPQLSFTATTLGSIIPNVTDQVYNLSSVPLEIDYDAFRILPSDYNVGQSIVQAFIFTCSDLPLQLSITNECLTDVSISEWIQFNSSTSALTVQTSNTSYLGSHTIVLFQYFASFSDVSQYTSFKIDLQPSPPKLQDRQEQAPYFEQEFSPQNVSQCPNQNASLWSFTLPRQLDPNNLTTTLLINFDNTFFIYDQVVQTLYQIKLTSIPSTKIINITLTNSNNISTKYQMEVSFYCNSVKSSPIDESNLTLSDLNPSKTPIGKIESVNSDKIQRPTAKISKVDSSGLLRIKFSQVMQIPKHPQLITNDTIYLNETIYPILELQIVAGKFTNPLMTKFNWTFVEFTPSELLIQLKFENINYISATNQFPDSIRGMIYGVHYFQDTLGDFMFSPTILNTKPLPPMASKSAIEEALNLAKNAQNSIFSLAVLIIISGPIQQVLSSFKHMQISVHLMLIAVNQPATVLIFFGGLMTLVNFQLIDFSNFFNKIFHLNPDAVGNNPKNSQFDMMGYGSLYIVQNFGMLCFTFFSPFLHRIAAEILVYFRLDRKIVGRIDLEQIKQKSQRQLQYGFWISFIDETYLFLLVCASINISDYFEWRQAGDAINSLLSCFFGIIIVTFPIFVALFYPRLNNFNKILTRNPDFKARFGSILVGLNFKRKGRLPILSICFSLVRKLCLGYIIVFHNSKPVLGIFIVMIQALIMIVVTGLVEPTISNTEHKMQLFNESFLLILSYHLLPLTDFMTDYELRNNFVGKSLIFVTLFNLGFNILIALTQNLLLTCRKISLWNSRRKYRASKLVAIRSKQLRSKKLKEWRQEAGKEISDQKVERRHNRQTETEIQQQNLKIKRKPHQSQHNDNLTIIDQQQHNQSKFAIPLLESREALLDALLLYSRVDIFDEELSREEINECHRIVMENRFGVDLQVHSRVQNKIITAIPVQNGGQTESVYDQYGRRIREQYGNQNNQQTFQARNVNVVSDLSIHQQSDKNYVNLKTKQNLLRPIQQSLNRRVEPEYASQFLPRFNCRPISIQRDASFEQLNWDFPGQAERKVLFTLKSEFYKTRLQLYAVRIDSELIRFGILVDGHDRHMVIISEGQTSRNIHQQLQLLLVKAKKLVCDFPQDVFQDIVQDRFASKMQKYIRQRDSRVRPLGFSDFGRITEDTSFKLIVRVYQEIRKHEELNRRIRIMCEQGSFI